MGEEYAHTFCAAFHFLSENFVLNHFIYKSSSCGRKPAARSHIVSRRGSLSILVWAILFKAQRASISEIGWARPRISFNSFRPCCCRVKSGCARRMFILVSCHATCELSIMSYPRHILTSSSSLLSPFLILFSQRVRACLKLFPSISSCRCLSRRALAEFMTRDDARLKDFKCSCLRSFSGAQHKREGFSRLNSWRLRTNNIWKQLAAARR